MLAGTLHGPDAFIPVAPSPSLCQGSGFHSHTASVDTWSRCFRQTVRRAWPEVHSCGPPTFDTGWIGRGMAARGDSVRPVRLAILRVRSRRSHEPGLLVSHRMTIHTAVATNSRLSPATAHKTRLPGNPEPFVIPTHHSNHTSPNKQAGQSQADHGTSIQAVT
jgi:hypothetical protein